MRGRLIWNLSRVLLTLALFLLALSGCRRIPPFSGDLSLQLLIADQFSFRERIGPVVGFDYFNSAESVVRFVPNQDELRSGFLLVQNLNSDTRISYYENAPESGADYHHVSCSADEKLPDPLVYRNFPGGANGERYLAIVAKTEVTPISPGQELFLFRYYNGKLEMIYNEILNTRLWSDFYDAGVVPIAGWTTGTENELALAGSFFNPVDGRLYICARHNNGGGLYYYECNYAVDSETGLYDPQLTHGNLGFQLTEDIRARYYFYSTELSGLTYLQPAGISFIPWIYAGTYAVQDSVELPGVCTHFLESGYFISNPAGVLRLYSMEGKQLNSLEDCDLVFCEEVKEGNDSLLLFSISYFIDGYNDDDRGLYLNLYTGTVSQLEAASF